MVFKPKFTPRWRTIGAKIKKTRLERGFSQEYLADMLGIPRNSLTYIEQGKRRLDAIEFKKVCMFLDVQPHDLWGD